MKAVKYLPYVVAAVATTLVVVELGGQLIMAYRRSLWTRGWRGK